MANRAVTATKMQKAPAPLPEEAAAVSPVSQGEESRTTIVLPKTVDRNVELVCAKLGKKKSEYFTDLAITDLRETHGLNPDLLPREVKWDVQY